MKDWPGLTKLEVLREMVERKLLTADYRSAFGIFLADLKKIIDDEEGS